MSLFITELPIAFENATFGRLLNAAVTAQCECEAIHGFQVTRKTFASNLLATGHPVMTIAAALGHVGVHAVDEYLATLETTLIFAYADTEMKRAGRKQSNNSKNIVFTNEIFNYQDDEETIKKLYGLF